jgi:tetratricopeptide (TPR) repeat protein
LSTEHAANLIQGTPIITDPWGDFDTVMRHAERAHAAGDHNKAHTFFARAVELKPDDARAWTGLAQCAATLDEAIRSWANALALTPGNLQAQRALEAAVQERLHKAQTVDAPVLVALGRTLAQVGQKSWAHRLLQRATELDAHNAEAWLWRAGVTTDNQEAIFCLKQVLAQHPDHPQALAGLKWIAARAAATASAVSTEDAAQEAESFLQQGQSALRAGNLTRAYDFFRLATEVNPHHESAWYWRASTAPNLEEALASMERVLALNPHNQTARDTLWLLRIKKIREEVQRRTAATASTGVDTLTSPSTPVPHARPQVARPQRRYGMLLFAMISFLIIVLGIGIAVWIWLTFFAGK